MRSRKASILFERVKKMALAVVCFIGMTAVAAEAAAPVTYLTSPYQSNPAIVPINEIFEITYEKNIGAMTTYGGEWVTMANVLIVDISVTFVSPTNKQTTIYGFFYNQFKNGNSIWKARFSPNEAGSWSYTYTFNDKRTPEVSGGNGTFTCVAGPNRGFIKRNPAHPMRWICADGTAFWPAGMNDGSGLWFTNTACIDEVGNTNGNAFGCSTGAFDETYWDAYSAAGFNMFRESPGNGGPPIFNWNGAQGIDLILPGNNSKHNGVVPMDQTLLNMRRHNIRVFLGLFTNYAWSSPVPSSVFDYVQYCINAWGAVVDVWEINNEMDAASASDSWLSEISLYLKAHDPYKHPVSQGFERPAHPDIDVIAPHTYTYAYPGNYAYNSTIESEVNTWKSYNKPILSGEAGNGPSTAQWFEGNSAKVRAELWVGLFLGMSHLYWNQSWATNGFWGGYLGPEERQNCHVTRWFSDIAYKPDSTEIPVTVSGVNLKGYGLSSNEGVAVYLFYMTDHTSVISGRTVTVNIPVAGTGYWIDTKTGKKLSTVSVTAGSNVLSVPSFICDIAFFSTSNSGLKTRPTAAIKLTNPQNDGDLDNDGDPDFGAMSWYPYGKPPLALTFDASDSQDLDGGAVTCSWDFGDGTTGSGSVVNHTYQRGVYTLCLTVTDDEGQEAKQYLIVRAVADTNINVNDPPVFLSMNPVKTTINEGEYFKFMPMTYSKEQTNTGYAWESASTPLPTLPPGATTWGDTPGEQTIVWLPSYDQSGTYTFNFTATDNGGLTATQSFTLTVLNVNPVGTPSTPAIFVTSPNGGENWQMNTAHTVTWTSSNLTGNVDIEISFNGISGPWTALRTATANDNAEAVTAPSTLGTACRIRVKSVSGTPSDYSDSDFTISDVPQPIVSVNTSSLDFGSVVQGQSGTNTFNITNNGAGTLSGTITKSQPWIAVTPASFNGNSAVITVTVDTTGLATGSNSGTVTVASNGGTDVVNITVNVTQSPAQPQITISSSSLSFGELAVGLVSEQQALTITNSGGGTLTGTISAVDSWINIDQTSFVIAGGASQPLNVSVDNSVLSQKEGPAKGEITITSNGNNGAQATTTISVEFTATCVLVKPNPVRLSSQDGRATITFFGDGIVPGQTTIKIYALSGELVNILNPQSEICNTQSPQSPGIYIYVYDSPREKGVNKFTLIR